MILPAHLAVLQDLHAATDRALTHQDDPGEVLEALALVARTVDKAQPQTVARMLTEGANWADVGRRLGVSRQAATQRFGARS